MTRAERLLVMYLAVAVPLVVVLPVELAELGIAIEVLALSVLAIVAGLYIRRVGHVARHVSEYLWLLVRRDTRLAIAYAMLAGLALATLVPRLVGDPGGILARPWGIVWLAVALNLFAVGLIDDALQMHTDRAIVNAAAHAASSTPAQLEPPPSPLEEFAE